MIEEILSSLGFEAQLIQEIIDSGFTKTAKKDDHIIGEGLKDKSIPIVLDGVLKVYRKEESGNEVLLYYLEKGETCAMSITCCLDSKPSEVKVIAETDVKIWMIPSANLDRWVSKYPSFRRYVFGAYQSRFDELMQTVDSLVFTNMEDRLLKYLLDTKQAIESFEIHKTHQEIADELNTSRVVVSRLLKKLEQESKIRQRRNCIEIL
ncbi:Crp/Fnr family transcriptional regulator [Ekhidna sp.]|uniref:Crp/Fnr family transcriptional regulator n=1 Tax=Ekhidna sp. TaxID=2608089 RepID=UPI003514F88B